MEIKHLRSDFIRSFLFKRFNTIIPEYNLDDPETLKFLNEYPTYILSTRCIVYTSYPINANLATLYPGNFIETLFGVYNLKDALYDYDNQTLEVIATFQMVILINKAKINTNEYYLNLTSYLTSHSPRSIIEKHLNSIGDASYQDLLNEKNKNIADSINLNVEKLPNTNAAQLDNKIRELNEAISELFTRIDTLNVQLKQLHGEKALSVLNNKNPIKDLIQYINKCKHVVGYSTELTSNYMHIYIYLDLYPLSYTYGDEALNKMVEQNPSLKENKSKDILMNALKARSTYEIMLAPLQLKLSYSLTHYNLEWNACTIDSFWSATQHCALHPLIKDVYDTYDYPFQNMHWFRYNCLGGFTVDIQKARKEGNPVKLFATLLQYLSTINITDAAGTAWLKQYHIIRNKQTNEWFVYDPTDGEITPLTKMDVTNLRWKRNLNAYWKENYDENNIY